MIGYFITDRSTRSFLLHPLFLLLSLSLVLGPLLPLAHESGLASCLPEGLVCILGSLNLADLHLLDGLLVLNRERLPAALDGTLAILGGLDVLNTGITRLGLAVTAREENEA